MSKVTLGGDRLGSGKKMQVELSDIGRSNHDQGFVWRNTQAPGTLVPFMSMVAKPGDTYEINIESLIKTMPTIGPLLGSFKFQADVFSVPIRLYQSALHNNPIGVGMEMNKFPLPKIGISCYVPQTGFDDDISTQQINPSSLISYLGMKSFGNDITANPETYLMFRKWNAVPYLAYFDIFKNYYANKQADNAYMVHTSPEDVLGNFNFVGTRNESGMVNSNNNVDSNSYELEDLAVNASKFDSVVNVAQSIVVRGKNLDSRYLIYHGQVSYNRGNSWSTVHEKLTEFFDVEYETPSEINYRIKRPMNEIVAGGGINIFMLKNGTIENITNLNLVNVNLVDFPLNRIDTMRELLLANPGRNEFNVVGSGIGNLVNPYARPFEPVNDNPDYGICCLSTRFPQEGLLVKTYQNDIFNNYLKNETVTGIGSIEELTKIDTSQGYFTLDQFNLASKVYKMLNRIAVAGATYKDFIESVYDIRSYLNSEIPVFEGGMFQEIIFEEIVNVAGTDQDPLGAMAAKGRGIDQNGGKIVVKCNEPSYIIGICSITPRIDYSQGNEWDTLLDTLDDIHKPQLDQIGFQDLLTDQQCGVTTNWGSSGRKFTAVGKQPAWINYMTNFNKLGGNFALRDNLMYMTLCRRYEIEKDGNGYFNIVDNTTYIDPAKFNYIFAQTSRDAMNFWVQLGIRINKRSVMSAKIMPNL